MAGQQAQSGLFKKYGNKLNEAVKKHANDETDYGFIQLPPGINGGVAQIVECGFRIYKTGPNSGEYFFRAAGVIIDPKTVAVGDQTITVAGKQTSVMEPVCETKTQKGKVTSQDEHIANITNHLRMLGIDTANYHGDGKPATGADLEDMAAIIKKAAPFFKFSTSVRKAQVNAKTGKADGPDGVWENWHGSKDLEGYTPPDSSGDGVNDSTGGDKEEPATGGDGDGSASNDKEAPAGDGGDDNTVEGKTVEELVAMASQDGHPLESEAGAKLLEIAHAAGVTEQQTTDAQNWDEIKSLIEEAQAGAGAATPDNDAPVEFKPVKGEIHKYAPIDPKTGKPILNKMKKPTKPFDVEVTAVDNKKGTCTVKSMDDHKVYANIKFSEVTPNG